MKSIEIEIHRQDNGRLWISLPNNEEINIEIKNAGIPGVIGPSLIFNTKEMVETELKNAEKAAFKSKI